MTARPRVALVHDYLTQLGGAERVVLELARAFPGAPLYTSVYAPDHTFPAFRELDVRTTVLDRIGYLRAHHRAALPALPIAFSSLRVDADVVLCSSSGWAHGVRTTGAKVVYCSTVARWLTQRDRYLGSASGLPGTLIRGALAATAPALRAWDARAAASATTYVANSEVTRRAVMTQYGIDAEVLHPPTTRLDVVAAPVPGMQPGFFLCVSRLLPYKNVQAVCDAFARTPDVRLLVVGDGPDAGPLRATAPANVDFRSHLDDAQLRWCYEQSAALVAASHEDFGLTVLEAAAAGRPVAALRAGGFLETVVEGTTGVFFDTPTPDAVAEAVRRIPARDWDGATIRAHAVTFSPDRFVARIREIVEAARTR